MSARLLLIISLVILQFSGLAQKVTVADRTTGQPLVNVAIISENPAVSGTTNIRGQADLTAFKESGSIVFRHIGYQTRTLSFSEVEQLRFFIDRKSVV